MPYHLARAEMRAGVDRPFDMRYGLLPRTMLPWRWGSQLTHAVTGDAGQLCALSGVAAYRYRLREGRWPERIEQLVGHGLTSVPIDPFDGKPLRLKPTPTGLVIYSIGDDLKDDGGAPQKYWSTPGDITFTVGQ